MKVKILLCIVCFLFIGCQRGDFKLSIVHTGQEAPHDGYFVDQSWYLYAGQSVPDDGYLVWVRGTDPNELME